MNKKYKIKNNKQFLNFVLMISILISICFLAIGYAAIDPITLEIKGSAEAKSQNHIFITDAILTDNKNADTANSFVVDFYQNILNSKVILSPSTTDTYVTYTITVYNSNNSEYYFAGTSYDNTGYDNSGIIFELSNIKEGTLLGSKEFLTFNITFKYKEQIAASNVLNSYIAFNFKQGYPVTYENITNSNLPSFAALGEIFTVNLSNVTNPIEVKMNGAILSSSQYTYTNNTLTIANVTGPIHIRQKKSYTLKNLVKNGSFENNLTNWSMNPGGSSSYWSSTSVAKFGSKSYYRHPSGLIKNYLLQSINWTQNHKYYYFAYGYCTTQQTLACDVTNRGNGFKISVGNKQWTKGGNVFTANFSGSNTISINYAESTGYVYVDGITVVDLTAAFGAGNEPDSTWCSQNIDYFDGSKTIYK